MNLKVQDLMYTQVYYIASSSSARDAAKLMAEKKVGSLLIKKDHDVVGIVTQGDLVERVIAKGQNPEQITVEQIKNYPLIMIDADTDIMEAADILTKYKVRRLIVMQAGKIAGIISTKVIGANLKRLVK